MKSAGVWFALALSAAFACSAANAGGRPFGGEMVYMADAAVFTECTTGRRTPIAMEGDFLRMEAGYRKARVAPGAPVYVTFDGAIVERPKMDGAGVERTIVVERFIHAWPGETCERAQVHASLANTYWRIVRLGPDEVAVAPGRREPHIVLRESDGGRTYSATVGCNRLIGGWQASGERIRFMTGAATMMACPPPLGALERRLSDALGPDMRWRVLANTLEFFDERGRSAALFQAVYF